jgi:hypothetical protein
MPEMLPGETLYPGIIDHILGVIDSEKTQVKIARIKGGRAQKKQERNADVALPWAGQDRGTSAPFLLSGLRVLFL